MARIEGLPSRLGKVGKKIDKKVIILFITILIILITIFMPAKVSSEINPISYNSTIFEEEGIDIQDKVIEEAVNNYVEKLKEEGYQNIDFELNYIYKSLLENNIQVNLRTTGVKEFVSNNFIFYADYYKITIDKKDYYFKNEETYKSFIKKINRTNKAVIVKDIVGKESTDAELAAVPVKKSVNATQVSGTGSSAHHLPIAHYKYISSRFTSTHHGVDLVAKKGTKILAWKSGKVITAKYSGNMGNLIEIKHADGSISRYGHLSAYNCHVGQTVEMGQVIGYVGATGNATGSHLHFEIKINGQRVNPLKYL